MKIIFIASPSNFMIARHIVICRNSFKDLPMLKKYVHTLNLWNAYLIFHYPCYIFQLFWSAGYTILFGTCSHFISSNYSSCLLQHQPSLRTFAVCVVKEPNLFSVLWPEGHLTFAFVSKPFVAWCYMSLHNLAYTYRHYV